MFAVAAVPVVEAVLVARGSTVVVPGPHPQDGVVTATGWRDEPVPIVWLGDSLAAGIGAGGPDQAFPRRAAALLSAAGCAVHLVCLAVPGARTLDVVEEQLPAALDRLGPGTVAVVTVGSNDVGRLGHPLRFAARYRSLLAALTATGATVVAVGLPDIGAATVMAQPLRAMLGWVGRRADRRIQRLATEHGAHFVAIDVSPPSGTASHVYLAADRWHPNDDTYHLWAEGTAALLAPLLLAGAVGTAG